MLSIQLRLIILVIGFSINSVYSNAISIDKLNNSLSDIPSYQFRNGHLSGYRLIFQNDDRKKAEILADKVFETVFDLYNQYGSPIDALFPKNFFDKYCRNLLIQIVGNSCRNSNELVNDGYNLANEKSQKISTFDLLEKKPKQLYDKYIRNDLINLILMKCIKLY